ncbi:hypothetical protein AVEN_205196-1 [Araneus ventricosus]|uniref:Uncharacterized protein n=1 Tax=Araneus ventricosus TaxID=182803 RepID=A0A4Y2IEZ1_ARAVE|nr:hypothetical protein AVEN_205196-1 [Araneus ventricosus]
MEYAKKIVLIPEDRAEIVDHLSDLDAKMEHILRRKDLIESEKGNRYLQVLQKFVKIQHPQQMVETSEIQETRIPENQEPENVPEEENAITAKILKAAPVRYLTTVKNILDFLKDYHSILTWTPEGEIVYKGQRIPRTNIVNLVTELLRNRKKSPPGFKEFHSALKEMNIPENYIVNQKIFKDNTAKILKDNTVQKPKSTKRLYAKRNTWIKY